MRDLNDLLTWLEYGRTSGYVAARESREQEEHWADLLRELMNDHHRLAQREIDAHTHPPDRNLWGLP
jgi:hypothetical protein